MDPRFDAAKAKANVWYWIQLMIWPLIRDTDCLYCIFIRGMLLGFVSATFIGAIVWLMK